MMPQKPGVRRQPSSDMQSCKIPRSMQKCRRRKRLTVQRRDEVCEVKGADHGEVAGVAERRRACLSVAVMRMSVLRVHGAETSAHWRGHPSSKAWSLPRRPPRGRLSYEACKRSSAVAEKGRLVVETVENEKSAVQEAVVQGERSDEATLWIV
ncbi:hypothetical protein MRB53_039382 [Persea americana]|nr:hypothetical protein MRB53_039382 [Persea americana]